MRWRARSVAWIAVLIAVLLQGALVSRLGIPFALTPLVVVVASMRMTGGEAAALGFFGGLLLDLAPPAAGVLGVQALVLCIAGYLAATKQHLVPHVWWARAVFAGGLTTLAMAAIILIQVIAGEPLTLDVSAGMFLVWQTLLGVVLAALLWPLSATSMGAPPRRPLGVAP